MDRYHISEDLYLEYGSNGFVLWYKKSGQWLIDASTIKNDGYFSVSADFKPTIEKTVYDKYSFKAKYRSKRVRKKK